MMSVKGSPRASDMSTTFDEWNAIQDTIREMLGTARAQIPVLSPRQRKDAASKPVAKLTELPHQRVWRERAEQKQRLECLRQRREQQAREEAEAREAEAAAAAAAREQARSSGHPLAGEMRKAQMELKRWFSDENSRFRRVFRAMDDDHNGWVDRDEVRTLPQRTGLAYSVKPQIMEQIIDLMDLDGDGRILYCEFVKIIMADDLFNP